MRVVMNAFLAAAAAAGLSYQKPISRYDVSPTTSQHINSSSRLLAISRPSIAPAKRERKQKNRVKFSSWCMYATL